MVNNIESTGPVRLAKACSTCRRKKVKCDGTRPICASCKAFGLPCEYQDSMRRQRRRSVVDHTCKLEKRIQDLEDRLRQIPRSKKRRLNSDSDDPDVTTRSQQDASRDEMDPESPHSSSHEGPESASSGRQTNRSASKASAEPAGVEGSYALRNGQGAMRFFGPSSYFSIISPSGDSLPENQTGNQLLRSIAHKSPNRWKLADWYPQGLQEWNPSNRRCSQSLPPKSLLSELVCEYFETINSAIPLFSPNNFNKLLSRQFSWNPNDSPSWWASLNVVLAFAYRSRAENLNSDGDDWQKCIGHIRNAMSMITELFMRTCDLLAVQAMIGLALFFQGTPNPQPLFMLTAAAIRASQSIGLHKSNFFGLPQSEVEERQRVFWIAFMLDADVCTRTGRPAAQDTRDFDTPLPLYFPQDDLGIIEIPGLRVNLFSLIAQFALIQRKVYDRLFSTEALRKPFSELVGDANSCIEEIDRWKDSIVQCLRPQRAFVAEPHPFLPHILRLHFACHCCYMNIYRIYLSIRHRGIAAGNDDPSLRLLLEESIVKSLEAARSAIDLINQVEKHQLGQSFEWSIVYFPAVAVVTLFSQMLVDPTYSEAEADLHMISLTVTYMSKIASQEQATYLDYVLSVCSGFEKAAKKAIGDDRSHKSHTAKDNHLAGEQSVHGSQDQSRLREGFLPQGDFAAACKTPIYPASSSREISRPFSDLIGQGLPTTMDPMSLEAPLFWNWQDMIAGVPPTYDYGRQF